MGRMVRNTPGSLQGLTLSLFLTRAAWLLADKVKHVWGTGRLQWKKALLREVRSVGLRV